MRYYFFYLSSLMKKAGFAQIMKGLEQFGDEALTVDWALDNIVIAGSPATVIKSCSPCASRSARSARWS